MLWRKNKGKNRSNCCKRKFRTEITEVLSAACGRTQLLLYSLQICSSKTFRCKPVDKYLKKKKQKKKQNQKLTAFSLLLSCHPSSVRTIGWSSPLCLKCMEKGLEMPLSWYEYFAICLHLTQVTGINIDTDSKYKTGILLPLPYNCCISVVLKGGGGGGKSQAEVR